MLMNHWNDHVDDRPIWEDVEAIPRRNAWWAWQSGESGRAELPLSPDSNSFLLIVGKTQPGTATCGI